MAFLSKSLPRRTLLKGLGTTLALPFLDAMLPPMRAAVKPSNRFQAFYVPNGMAMEYWTPKGEGEALELRRSWSRSRSTRSRCWSSPASGRAGTTSMPEPLDRFLPVRRVAGKNEIEIIADVSIDQLLGRHLAQQTQLASLEMSMDLPANAGACTGNLSCAYLDTLSWRSPTQPLPMDWNPRTVFEKLFGDSGSTDEKAREARLAQHKSILDSVNAKLTDLSRELGPADHGKVTEYTDAVRDVERRIQMAERQSEVELPSMAEPLGAPPVFEDHLALMMDLQVLAFQSDLTRVISFMLSKEQSPRPYPQIGVPEAHHPLSHHNNVPELVERMSKINTYHALLFSKYLDKLAATKDGDGTLLEHITILYGAGISNSNAHSGENLPQMIVGGGAGKIKGGRHLKYTNRPSQANLLLTLMDKMDYPVEKVGGSTGKLHIDSLAGV